MSNYAVMPHAHFTSLMSGAAATRRNRGRPGRKGLPSKRVIEPKPANESIAALLFYKETYTPAGEKQAAFDTDAKARDFMKQYGLTTFAPIENTPSFRRVRIKKTANFDITTLRTYRIQGHEDVLVITGRLLTPDEIKALGARAVALEPRKATLRAAGVRTTAATPEESEIKTLTEVERMRNRITSLEAVLADPTKASAALSAPDIRSAIKYFREERQQPKTEAEIKRMPPKDVRTLLLSYARTRLKQAEARAANIGQVQAAGAAVRESLQTPPSGGTKKPAEDRATAEDIKAYLEVWNGETGEEALGTQRDPQTQLPIPQRLSKKQVEAMFKDRPRADFLTAIKAAVAVRDQMRAAAEERLRVIQTQSSTRRRRPVGVATPSDEDLLEASEESGEEAATAPPPPPPAQTAARGAQGTELSKKEIAELASLMKRTQAEVARNLAGVPRETALALLAKARGGQSAAPPPRSAAPTTASVVPEAPSIPPFMTRSSGGSLLEAGPIVIENIDAEGKATQAVTNYLKGIFKDLGITSRDEQNVAANVILARALSAQDARNRADAFAEIYEQTKAQANAKSLIPWSKDSSRLRELDATLRGMVGPAEYIPPLASLGRPTQHLRPRASTREGEESGTVEESEQAMRREEAGPLLRPNRRAPTLRKPRGSNRFTKVREAQEKQERLAASLPAVRRDLGVARRRLTMLKGKRTAQAKYARDQLQAEATRLMRRIEKIEGQVERAAAAVARAVKAANPKKKQPKVKPLKQPKAKKPKATRKRPTTAKRRR
jgi:hypothetical protein